MNISFKNILIMLAFIFLVSGDVMSSIWGMTKALVYTIVFFIIIQRVAPDLYQSLGSIFNLKKIELNNIGNLILKFLMKILDCIPFVNGLVKKLCDNDDTKQKDK